MSPRSCGESSNNIPIPRTWRHGGTTCTTERRRDGPSFADCVGKRDDPDSIVNLDAGVKLTASDGESRLIGAGEVILVGDTTGKGHLSDHVEGKIRHSIFIPIE